MICLEWVLVIVYFVLVLGVNAFFLLIALHFKRRSEEESAARLHFQRLYLRARGLPEDGEIDGA